MKNLKQIFMGLASLLVMGAGSAALAQSPSGVFVEPSITYEMGDHTVDWSSTLLSNSSGKTQGLGVGLRGGFHLNESFFLGLDGRYSMPTFKDSSVDYDAQATSINYGPVIGFQMPDMGLRIWGTYILGGDMDPKASGNYDVALKKANGLRAGLGFRVQAFSINLEYEQLKYGQSVLEQAGPFTPGYTSSDVELENKSWIASVSFPIEM